MYIGFFVARLTTPLKKLLRLDLQDMYMSLFAVKSFRKFDFYLQFGFSNSCWLVNG